MKILLLLLLGCRLFYTQDSLRTIPLEELEVRAVDLDKLRIVSIPNSTKGKTKFIQAVWNNYGMLAEISLPEELQNRKIYSLEYFFDYQGKRKKCGTDFKINPLIYLYDNGKKGEAIDFEYEWIEVPKNHKGAINIRVNYQNIVPNSDKIYIGFTTSSKEGVNSNMAIKNKENKRILKCTRGIVVYQDKNKPTDYETQNLGERFNKITTPKMNIYFE